jgi:hypothetical protein
MDCLEKETPSGTPNPETISLPPVNIVDKSPPIKTFAISEPTPVDTDVNPDHLEISTSEENLDPNIPPALACEVVVSTSPTDTPETTSASEATQATETDPANLDIFNLIKGTPEVNINAPMDADSRAEYNSDQLNEVYNRSAMLEATNPLALTMTLETSNKILEEVSNAISNGTSLDEVVDYFNKIGSLKILKSN